MVLLFYEVYIDVILSKFWVVLAGTFKVEGIVLDDLLGGRVERWGGGGGRISISHGAESHIFW